MNPQGYSRVKKFVDSEYDNSVTFQKNITLSELVLHPAIFTYIRLDESSMSTNSVWFCSACKTSFASRKTLRLHCMKLHVATYVDTGRPLAGCSVCGKFFR